MLDVRVYLLLFVIVLTVGLHNVQRRASCLADYSHIFWLALCNYT